MLESPTHEGPERSSVVRDTVTADEEGVARLSVPTGRFASNMDYEKLDISVIFRNWEMFCWWTIIRSLQQGTGLSDFQQFETVSLT